MASSTCINLNIKLNPTTPLSMPQITPIRGFTNTPVTKSICIVVTLSALLVLVLLLKPYLKLAVDPLLVEYAQYWRVATFQLSVVNESDYMLSMVLWFHFKTLERFFGSRKYLSLVVLFALYNAVATVLVLCLGQLLIISIFAATRFLIHRNPFELAYFDTVLNSVIPGPLGILSLLYVCYGTYIPVSYHFKILLRKLSTESSNYTLNLTNQFQVHIIYILLVLNNGFGSIIACLVGLLIGRLYTLNLLAGSKNWVLPSILFRLFVSPRKLQRSTFRSFTRSLEGYRRIPATVVESVSETAAEEESQQDRPEEEDAEVAIDDIRNLDENAANRSATPVRPLGRQFLDTFRT